MNGWKEGKNGKRGKSREEKGRGIGWLLESEDGEISGDERGLEMRIAGGWIEEMRKDGGDEIRREMLGMR